MHLLSENENRDAHDSTKKTGGGEERNPMIHSLFFCFLGEWMGMRRDKQGRGLYLEEELSTNEPPDTHTMFSTIPSQVLSNQFFPLCETSRPFSSFGCFLSAKTLRAVKLRSADGGAVTYVTSANNRERDLRMI